MYSIIGDLPAPYFFGIDQESGEISVKNDLKLGRNSTYIVC